MGCQMRTQLAEPPPCPDLYLRGDGVPANCDQARVLLLVASEKRDAQAIKELEELDKTGWPAPSP